MAPPSTTKTTTLLSAIALLPLLAHAQDACPGGTTYSTLCCQGTLLGGSVAIPPETTFPVSPPPTDFTATNNFAAPIPTEVESDDSADVSDLPSTLINDTPVTDSEGLASLSRELDSLVSQAATDTNIVSILPIMGPGPVIVSSSGGDDGGAGSGGIWDPEGTMTETSLAPGVTCRGFVETIVDMGSMTLPFTTGSMEESASPTMTGTESGSGSAGETTSAENTVTAISEGGVSGGASTGAAAAVTGGVGALLGVGLAFVGAL